MMRGENRIMSHKLFSELGLSDAVLKAIEKMGFEQASPIQSEAIPPLLEGKDMIGQSQTGSGKTAAFGIPAVERVDESLAKPQVLIMCPTRELASQVAEEIANSPPSNPVCVNSPSTVERATSVSSEAFALVRKSSSAPQGA